MYYVYLLKSISNPNRMYTGYTTNLTERLSDHNSGKSVHTAKFKPWSLEVYIAFADEKRAQEFERYLKSGSGRVFAKKHF